MPINAPLTQTSPLKSPITTIHENIIIVLSGRRSLSGPRVNSVFAHDELDLALHFAVVDATTFLQTHSVTLLVRLLVVHVTTCSLHHLLVAEYPDNTSTGTHRRRMRT